MEALPQHVVYLGVAMKSFRKVVSVFALVTILACSGQAIAISGTKPPPNAGVIVMGFELPMWISDLIR